jgi:sugar phosphate isomerase/epimerase
VRQPYSEKSGDACRIEVQPGFVNSRMIDKLVISYLLCPLSESKKMRILFFHLLIASLFIVSCSEQHAEPVQQEPIVSDVGVVSYTFRNQFSEDVPGTLDMIREMGFSKIEFSNLFGSTAEEIRNMLDERELICTSYGTSYENLMQNIDQVIDDAKTLGAKYVRVASIPHDREQGFSLADMEKAIADFNEAGRILRENDLHFNYHNHGYEFLPHNDGTLFDYLVENTDPDYVNFEIDVFWVAHPGHDPVELLKKYPDRFHQVHLKDLSKDATHDYSGGAPAEYDVRLGTGQIDFPAFLRASTDSAIEHFYIEDETEDVIERVPQSKEYITGITE